MQRRLQLTKYCRLHIRIPWTKNLPISTYRTAQRYNTLPYCHFTFHQFVYGVLAVYIYFSFTSCALQALYFFISSYTVHFSTKEGREITCYIRSRFWSPTLAVRTLRTCFLLRMYHRMENADENRIAVTL